MKHFTKFYYFSSLLICFLLAVQSSYADGSKDLYPGGNGGRAKLRSSTVSSASYPFASLNTHYVYVKAGETITMASSVMGLGNARIKLTKPDGTITSYSGATGLIANRVNEVAGPRLPGVSGGNYYDPILYAVPVGGEGIYSVDFVPPAGEAGTNTNGREASGVLATANWKAATNSDVVIAAWDVSVYGSNNALIPGRVYSNVLNLDIYNDFSATRTYYGKMYVLTKDGYIYKVDNNGNNGISFEFFVNSNGFVNGTGEPIYKSLNTSTGISSQVKDPRTADNTTSVTHKMFYTLPANDLPQSASGAVAGGTGTTWLKNPRLVPKVSDLKLFGVEGTEGQIGNKGGNIKFNANLSGRYIIEISPVAPANFSKRTITGFAGVGLNSVKWDGKDGSGNPLPSGNSPAKLTIRLQGAEVHFPYFDMEINPDGIKLELLNTTLDAVESDIVYWDDTDITLTSGVNNPPSNPINASQFAIPAGTSSNINGHKWGSNLSPTSGTFGDNRSMDTWTFVLGAEETLSTVITTKVADLKVNSITPDVSTVGANGNITYTVEVQNSDGSAAYSDVANAPFSFNVPTGMEIVSVVYTSACGTESNGTISADKLHYNSELKLTNGCKGTYTILTKAVGAPSGKISVEATIMRPNDVNDPDATNPDPNVLPTDPHLECKNGTATESCNNIKYNNVVTLINKITAVKSIVGDPVTVKPGDVLTYNIILTNTDALPKTGVTASDAVPSTLTNISAIDNGGIATGNTINWANLTVPANGTLTLSFKATVAANLPAGTTSIKNTASVVDPIDPTKPIEPVVEKPTEGKITAVKSIVGNPATVKPGDVLTYNITLTNSFGAVKTGVTASDAVPSTLTNISAIDNGGIATGNTINWANLTVPANGTLTLSFKATVAANLPAGTTSIKNTASVVDPIDPTKPIEPVVEKPTEGKITAVKSIVGNPATVKPGDVLTYNITLTNSFGAVKTGVTASDAVPSTLTNISAIDNGGIATGNTINWANLTVPANGTLTLSFKATVAANLPAGTTSIKNTASVVDPIDPTKPIEPVVEKPTEGKITAVKSIVGNPATVKPGDVLTYNITLTNSFGAVKTGVTASDAVPSTLTNISAIDNGGIATGNTINWANLTVPANGTLTLSFKATVAANLPAGTTSIKNTASVVDPIDPTKPIEPVVEKPTEGKITAVKSIVGNPATVKPGDVLTYNITLTNSFGAVKTGVTASDAVPSTLTNISAIDNGGIATGNTINWANLTVPANGTLTLSFKATVAANLPAGTTSIKNTASVVDPIDPTKPVEPFIEKPTEGKITAVKSIVGSPATVKPGDVLTYNIVLTNSFGTVKTGVTASDNVPSTLTNISAIDNGGIATGNTINWANLTVPANGTLTLSFKATVVANLPAGTTSIKNTASVVDPIDPTKPVEPFIEKPTEGKITAVKSIVGNPATVKPGDVLTYNIVLTNSFGTAKTGVSASDAVPSTLTNISAIDNGGVATGNTINWTNLTVPANGTLTLSFKATVAANLPAGTTSIKNTASVVDPIDPTKPVEPFIEKPTEGKITAVKSIVGDPATVKPGDVLTYNITLTNSFGTVKTGVTASDNVPSTLTNISAIDNGGVATGNTINWSGLTVPANGTLTLSFKATVVANLPAGTTSIKNTASVVDPIDPTKPVEPFIEKPTEGKITAIKSIVGDPATVKPGDVLTYNITLTNSFGTVKTGVTASDASPSTLTNISGIDNGGVATGNTINWSGLTVPANGTLTLSFKATVVANLPAGTTSIKNTASVVDPIDPTKPVEPFIEKPTEGKITAVKSIVGDPATVKPGDVLTYNITLTNSFGTAKTGVTASDVVPSTLTGITAIDNGGTATGNTINWANLTVPANGTLTLSFKATVAANLPAGTTSIKNTASVVDPIDPTKPVEPVIEKPTEGKITAVKSIVGDPATVKPGDVLTYNITLTNSFGTVKTGVTASDAVPSTLTNISAIDNGGIATGNTINWANLTVPANGTLTLSFKATVVANLPAGTTSIKNTASVVDPIDPTKPVEPFIEKPTEGKITAVKSIVGDPATVKPGDVLTYNITLTNSFGTVKTGVTASDVVPSTLTNISAIDNGGVAAGNTINWSGLTVPANGTLTLSFKATVVANLPAGTTSIKNTASVVDPIDPTKPVEPFVEKPTEGKITAVKSIVGDPATVKPGDVLTYNITLTNSFGTAKTGVTASDAVPSTLTNISAIDNGGVATGNTINWTNLTVPANGTLTLSFKATVVANLPAGTTSIKNTASVVDPIDPTKPVEPVIEKPIIQNPKIALVKQVTNIGSGAGGAYQLGDQIEYTFKITNMGDVVLRDIVLNDPLIGNANISIPGELSVSAAINYVGHYTVTQDDVDAGKVTNSATVEGTAPNGTKLKDVSGNKVDNDDPTVTVITQKAKLTLVKTGTYTDTNNDGKVNVGDKITYAFTVSNVGNATIKDIMITDAKVAIAGGPVTLSPGAIDNSTFTAIYTITQADIDAGRVDNMATTTGKDPNGKPVTATSTSGNPVDPSTPIDPKCKDCTITPLPSSPLLNLTKTAISGTYSKIGNVITYNLVLKNIGNVTVTDINITDENADAGSITPANVSNLAPNAIANLVAKHTITLADLDRGYVSNLAKADGKDPKGGNVHAESTDPSPVPGAPKDPDCPKCTITPAKQIGSIALVKKVTNTGSGQNGAFILGNEIEYTFTVTNTGNISLKDIVLNDPLLNKPAISIPGIIAPGESVSHKEKYTIISTDIAKGNVTNQAVVNASDPKGNKVTDQSGTAINNDDPTVVSLAKPPVAMDDIGITQQNHEVVIPLSDNDLPGNSDLDPASITIIGQPAHGKVVVNADGTVTYKPDPGYTGEDKFTYTIKDKNGQVSNIATGKITVTPTQPIANDDEGKTTFNKPIEIKVIDNDKENGAPFDKGSVKITDQPKHGTVSIGPDGTVTYTPNSGYTGKDEFTYTVKDVNGNITNTATVKITIDGFFIPNVITPNGDGKNDAFVIVGKDNYDTVEIEVYNRWGNQVYRHNNYQNNWTGEGLNEGTYYYVIRLKKASNTETVKGWILIKR